MPADVSKDPYVPVLSLRYRGARRDEASISLYQGPDTPGGTDWTLIPDADIEQIGELLADAIQPLTNAQFTKIMYGGQTWTSKDYTPQGGANMRDTAIFTFETSRVKTVSLSIPAFKLEKLIPTHVQGGSPTVAGDYATSLYNEAQNVNMADADVQAFLTAIITGVTSTSGSPVTFSPHARTDVDGDIVAAVDGIFQQKASPRRTAIKG
jgi:hypothetical protein